MGKCEDEEKKELKKKRENLKDSDKDIEKKNLWRLAEIYAHRLLCRS